jgi:hypothetical protein
MGISKILSKLHMNESYCSILQNILDKKKAPPYFILRLGGSEPYLKFGKPDGNDWQYYSRDNKQPDKTEYMEWLNLIEPGKLVLALRHIRFIFRDEENNRTREEFAFTHCIDHGCRTTLDTKTYFMYGPESQLDVYHNI